MSPQEKVLDKLSKLMAMKESEAAIGNTEAAEAFASMINAMLLRHNLSAEQVPVGGTVKEEPITEVMFEPTSHGFQRTKARVGWQEALAGIVAEAHLCKHLISRRSNCIWFVGTETNAKVAEHAYAVLVRAADRMSMAARVEWWKKECGGKHLASGNYRAAWLHGFIERIAERFREARRAEVQATGDAGTALIRLDQALVRARDYVKVKYTKKPIEAATMRTGNYQGRIDGRAAADKMNVGQRGVGQGSGSRQLKGGA
jgi:hypothetical protein